MGIRDKIRSTASSAKDAISGDEGQQKTAEDRAVEKGILTPEEAENIKRRKNIPDQDLRKPSKKKITARQIAKRAASAKEAVKRANAGARSFSGSVSGGLELDAPRRSSRARDEDMFGSAGETAQMGAPVDATLDPLTNPEQTQDFVTGGSSGYSYVDELAYSSGGMEDVGTDDAFVGFGSPSSTMDDSMDFGEFGFGDLGDSPDDSMDFGDIDVGFGTSEKKKKRDDDDMLDFGGGMF